MAKINNVGLNLGQKIANPFKTSRNSTTNPFKYSNFEGNTLQFADVFEGFEPKKVSKMKMISASVAGSMAKFRSNITEPIINFVNRMKDGIYSAWDYAKNTNISDIQGYKAFNEVMNTDVVDIGKDIGNSLSGMGKAVADKIPFLNVGKGLSSKWSSLISKVHNHNKITKDTSVDELKMMWQNEIAKAESEAA